MAEQRLRHAPRVLERVEGDFPAWTGLRDTPRLYVVDRFANDDEVARVLEITRDLDAWRRRGVSVKDDATGASFELPIDSDEVLRRITARTYAALGVDNAVAFTVRYRHYRVTESHPMHTDTFVINGAHLVATALLCLTAPAEGGSTDFPLASPPVRVPYRRGRLVAWLNLLPTGAEDPQAAHSAAAVTAGDKITITNFIYADPQCSLVREGPACAAR